MIQGKWYPKDSSNQYPAHLMVRGNHYIVEINANTQTGNHQLPAKQDNPPARKLTPQAKVKQELQGEWAKVSISDRLGNTERKLTLADGSLFTTPDNQAIDELVATHKHRSHKGTTSSIKLHKHETKLSSVITVCIFTVAVVLSFAKWGLPWTSEKIAHALPQKTGELIGKHSLDFMDDYFLEKTSISDAEQKAIISRFNERLKPLGKDKNINYQLHFRDMKMNGTSIPNAFALPSGDIILTDKFVQLSKTEDELDSVLLHEMGHVEMRHSLELMTQSSLTTMIVMLVLGNPDGISEVATGLGTALVTNHYSRKYESEADKFAFEQMLKGGINPQSFISILARMEDYANNIPDKHADSDSETKDNASQNKTHDIDDDADADADAGLSDFFSTHPDTQLRIKMAEKYKSCFEQGLSVCD